jgi:hypothetical protein
VGVSLREGRPSMEVCARASERLTELIGDMVTPLEQDISKAATKHLPQFQSRYASLGEKLNSMELPGIDRIHSLNKDIADVLFTDASDAPERLGGEESILYDNLKWAGEVDVAFKQGLEKTIRSLQKHRKEIKSFPASGVPGQLKDGLADEIKNLEERLASEEFYKHAIDLNTVLTNIEASTRDTAGKMLEVQRQNIKEADQDLSRLPEWVELTQEEQSIALGQLEELKIEAEENLDGLKRLITHEFNIHSTVQDLRKRIIAMGKERARENEKERRAKAREENTFLKTVSIPISIASLKELNDLLKTLEEVRANALKHEKVEIRFQLDHKSE